MAIRMRRLLTKQKSNQEASDFPGKHSINAALLVTIIRRLS